MNASPNRHDRGGFTLMEALVCFGILSAVMASAVPMVVALGEIDDRLRDRQFAWHELANIHARGLAGGDEGLRPEVGERLRNAELTRTTTPVDGGIRIDLTLFWPPSQSVTLSRLAGEGSE